MTFISDLKFGEKYQVITKQKLGNSENIEIKQGKFKPYDIIDNSSKIKYEIKSDKITYKSGNICIEYKCNNVDSGITSTESNYYYYYAVNIYSNRDYERFYIIPTDVIKKEILKCTYFKSLYGGDGNRSQFYLFKEKIFQNYLQ